MEAGTVAEDFTPDELRRYGRHLTMPEVGLEGQKKLRDARVLLVGAGGLGSPAAIYLAAAGVGHLGLVDFDAVELSNLHRQILHDTGAVGESKLASARRRLEGINPEIRLETIDARLDSTNAMEILEGFDLVVDGSDNFPTRYLVNDASFLSGIPSVYGAIFRWDGQAAVFGMPGGPCYRCLFREPPPPGLVPSCAEAGVLGVLPGIVGSIQATEAIKLILGKESTLSGRLLLIDALEMSFRELTVRRDPECPLCGDEPTIRQLIDYEAFCGSPAEAEEAAPGEPGRADGQRQPDTSGPIPGIEVEELSRRLESGEDLQLVDVRQPYEWAVGSLEDEGARLVPLDELAERLDELDPDRETVVYCRSGGRSAAAVELMRREGFERAVNLEGGIMAWARRVDPGVPT